MTNNDKSADSNNQPQDPNVIATEGNIVFCRYVIRNGKRIYPKHAKYFRFFVKPKVTA